MKTITECQPLIYGLLMAQAEHRKVRQRKNARRIRVAMPMLYVVVGLAIVFDAGIVPWDVRFWLIFSPFFLLGESVLSAVSKTSNRSGAAEGGKSELHSSASPTSGTAPVREAQKRRNSVRRARNQKESSVLTLREYQAPRRELYPSLLATPKRAVNGDRIVTAPAFSRSTVTLARSH